MTENIVLLYNEFVSAKLFAALKLRFDIEADYAAYTAYVKGDGATLAKLTEDRLKLVGADKAVFKKGERKLALRKLAIATRSHKSKPISYPAHFVGTEGKQGTDKHKANFSNERPKKVSTPLGGETDNTEVFNV